MARETPKSVTPDVTGSNLEKQYAGNEGKHKRRGRNRRGGTRVEDSDTSYLMCAIHSDNKPSSNHSYRINPNPRLENIQNLLLLDSCSTVCLISDSRLLHNIHRAEKSMTVQCNAGTRTTRHMGWIGTFPEPVWYDPGGAANIMSLHIMKRYYHVTYDSDGDDAFVVTTEQGRTMRFTPTEKGLYACTNDTNEWAFVNTVAEEKSKLSKRALKDAALARRVQNIIMFPGTQAYAKIADHNLIPNCPVTRADIIAAENIYGPNINALKGKTVKRPGVQVKPEIDNVPPEILAEHKSITLEVDIMFVNKMPFLITTSRKLRFGTAEHLPNRQHTTVVKAIQRVVSIYHRRGFNIRRILADPEFEAVETAMPGISFNLCAQDEHIPGVERYIRTVKDRARSGYNALPFQHLPRLMVSRLVGNAIFWLNAFPHPDGVSQTLSPRYIMTGKHIDYKKHVRLEFGAYVQTHEDHNNDMQRRTVGAICLGPSGNEQGGHYFMSLSTGQRLHRDRWTALPMPQDVINRVSNMGKQQKMPKSLTFADRFGHELEDLHDEVDDAHDSDYDPDDNSSYSSSSDDMSYSYSSSSDDMSYMSGDSRSPSNYSSDSQNDDDDSDGPNDGWRDTGNAQPLPGLSGGVPAISQIDAPEQPEQSDQPDQVESGGTSSGHQPVVTFDDDAMTDPVEPTDNTPYLHQTAGVDDTQAEEDQGSATSEASVTDIMDNLYGPRTREHNLRPRRKRDYTHRYGDDEETMLAAIEEPMGLAFLTEQMSAKKGLKTFGEAGANAIVDEMQQLEYRDVLEPVHRSELTPGQRRKALRYLMYLKQKRCGRIKARGCADGRKQRIYKTKEETSSPTISTEALFLTAAIDAKEKRHVITVDIPGAFMHATMDEVVHMKLEGTMAELLCRVDPNKYTQYRTTERGKATIYVRLKKALYGTLQAALLFWQNLSSFLTQELGFEINPYDQCVANKTINGSQCTVAWHVDDLKISHKKKKVLKWVVEKINNKYGKEAPLTVHWGDAHEYLGMCLDYSVPGKVTFRMEEYLQTVLNETPRDMTGTAITPATNRLFDVNPESVKLTREKADEFHHITARLLYLCKRARPDIQTTISFLCTRVKEPDTDDWKKLCRCVRYLRGSSDLWLTLEVDRELSIRWWVDASFGVHPDLRSHTGGTMSIGRGSVYSISRKQKLNTRSSTEAELVGVDDAMPLVLWTRLFLTHQGLAPSDNVIYQDNQSAMRLERNGRSSCGKQTRHLNMRYFFIADRIKAKQVRIEYCPTEHMIGDFFTKPLQGAQFRRLRGLIMNLPDGTTDGNHDESTSKECVGKPSYADIVRGPHSEKVDVDSPLTWSDAT